MSTLLQRIERVLLSEDQALQSVAHNYSDIAEFLVDVPEPYIAASVLFGLVMREHGLHVLLTKRAEHLRRHPGQISFPGGRIEATDADVVQAALREAHEEIMLNPQDISVLGFLGPLLTITGFKVYPVVAYLHPDYQVVPDGAEVSEVFEVPLALFLDADNDRFFELEYQGKSRRLVEFVWQQHRIWGATAMMLLNFRQRLGAQ
jgi:8-oxo-dGTP pyrophosphatase MutT (NUDIX family)